MINYEDFVNALETRSSQQMKTASTTYAREPSPRETLFGATSSVQTNIPLATNTQLSRDAEGRWYNSSLTVQANNSSVDSTPRSNNAFETMNKFRSTLQGFHDDSHGSSLSQGRDRDRYQNNGSDVDDYSERGRDRYGDKRGDRYLRGSLSPPKVTDSSSFHSMSRTSQPVGGAAGAGHLSPIRNRQSQSQQFLAPKTSPSRVGTLLWGSHTPLSRKGEVPFIDEHTWCCAVCLYSENPSSAGQCVICDSVNHNTRQVRACF
jgi:hypothetical protein